MIIIKPDARKAEEAPTISSSQKTSKNSIRVSTDSVFTKAVPIKPSASRPIETASVENRTSSVLHKVTSIIEKTFQFFCLLPSRKKITSDVANSIPASGIDLTCGNRYLLTESTPIGSGAYGSVYAGIAKSSLSEVAIKIVTKGGDHLQPPRKEVEILQYLETVKKTARVGVARFYESWESDTKIAIVTERLGENLNSFMLRNPSLVNIDFIRILAKQTLESLLFLRNNNIIHGDIKPSNMVFTKNKRLKLIDMGLSHSTFTSASPRVTHSLFPLQALEYRCLKVHLKIPNYSTEIDLWSLGCILFKALSGRPLISHKDINKFGHEIVRIMGPIPYDFYQKSPKESQRLLVKAPGGKSTGYIYKEQLNKDGLFSCTGIRSQIPSYRKPRVSTKKKQYKSLLDLIEKLLSYKPASIETLLAHEALRDLPLEFPT